MDNENMLRRIKACIEACSGIDTEALEKYPIVSAALLEERNALRAALERIAAWEELPIDYRINYGSNGQRDYYRNVAREALRGAK